MPHLWTISTFLAVSVQHVIYTVQYTTFEHYCQINDSVSETCDIYATFVDYCHISSSVGAACNIYSKPHLWTIAILLTVSVQHVIYTVYHICKLLPHFQQCQCSMWYILYTTFVNYCHISNRVSAACDIFTVPHLCTIATFLTMSVKHVICTVYHICELLPHF